MSTDWCYTLTPRSIRDLERLSRHDRLRVFAALDRLIENPLTGDIKKLEGKRDEWRLRVGTLRVRFTPDFKARTVVVRRVDQRSRAYRD